MPKLESIAELAALIAAKGINLESVVLDRTGCEWDYSAKSFDGMGFDTLDLIEVIMDLENLLGCEIADSLAEQIYDADPGELLVSVRRSRRLGDIGI